MCRKSIAAASPWLQCLLLRLAQYDVEPRYLMGKDDVIADSPSQVSPLEPESEDRDNFGTILVHHTTSEILATVSQLEAVRLETQADQVLSQLNARFSGMARYWEGHLRKHLPILDLPGWGVIWRQVNHQDSQVHDSHIQWKEFLHVGHLGEEKMLL